VRMIAGRVLPPDFGSHMARSVDIPDAVGGDGGNVKVG
jgi:hypothetical protein